MKGKVYLAVDLKSFYASVECIKRGSDPLTINLVVADKSRTEKTICLAVSPSLKAYGIPGRARLFEVVQKVAEVNALRRQLTGSSSHDPEVRVDPALALDLVGQRLVTNQLTLMVGYDIDNLRDPERRKQYQGTVSTDRYGRQIPKHTHGTANLESYTASSKLITAAILELFDRIVDKNLLVRRMHVTANRVTEETAAPQEDSMEQLDLFTDFEAAQAEKRARDAELAREKKLQEAMLDIKSKFGKNAILKGTNLVDGATAAERNGRIGGHKA